MSKQQQYGEGRKCRICGATISMYNKLDRCFCHGIVDGVNETIPIEKDRPPAAQGKDPIGFMRSQYDYYGEAFR